MHFRQLIAQGNEIALCLRMSHLQLQAVLTISQPLCQPLPVVNQVAPVDPDASLAAAAVAAVPRRVARENIKELLAKKRETLLVQVGDCT